MHSAATRALRAAAVAVALVVAAFTAAPLATAQQLTNDPTPYRYRFQHKINTKNAEYPYDAILGMSFLFFEAQRSGKLSEMPDGGNRIIWRGDQLLDDGKDIKRDLSGGYYEAGNRLKVTLPTAYTIARLAFSCLYFHDVWAGLEYDGETMLYWCKREVKWGAYWLLKAHIPGSNKRSTKWSKQDKLVIMVGEVRVDPEKGPPLDFECYRRAENIPIGPNCNNKNLRGTLVADWKSPAADHAAEASAALILSAALLVQEYPDFAEMATKSSMALYDFAVSYTSPANKIRGNVGDQLDRLYPSTTALDHIMYAGSVLTFIFAQGCAVSRWPFCNERLARQYLTDALYIWNTPNTQGALYRPVVDWDATYLDAALIFDILAANATSEFREAMTNYMIAYAKGDGSSGIESSDEGLRTQQGEDWANLRLATFSSAMATYYVTLADVAESDANIAMCLARSQMGYVLGDTGRSYVVGYGPKFPLQVHHRDAACTLEEDAAGKCTAVDKGEYAFIEDRPNPYVLYGAIVGGPAANDSYSDDRTKYEFTEVALDYNIGLTLGLVGMASVDPDFWVNDVDCSLTITNYPWSAAARAQDKTAVAVRLPSWTTIKEASGRQKVCEVPQNRC